jgi:hypothetical protein
MASTFATNDTFKPNTALSQFRLLTLLSNGKVGYSGTTDSVIGTADADTPLEDFANVKVNGLTAGVIVAVTNVPITIGSRLYAGASGYANITGTVDLGLIAAQAASENGTVVRAIPAA